MDCRYLTPISGSHSWRDRLNPLVPHVMTVVAALPERAKWLLAEAVTAMLNPSEKLTELSQQAQALQDAGKFHEAVAIYDTVLAIEPRYVESWINKGLALWRLGQPDAALPCYNSALELEPGNAIAWMNKGNALSNLAQYDEALSCYDRSLELDPTLARAWYNKGDELGRRSRVIEAKACFENAYNLGLSAAREMIALCEQILMNEWYG